MNIVEKFGGPNAVVAYKKFEPIQKRAVKWILCETNNNYNEYDYVTRLKQLNLLPIQYFYQFKKLKLFHKVLAGSLTINKPEYIVQHRLSYLEHNCNKSVSSDTYQPLVRPFGNSFYPSVISLWNSLPLNIRNIESHNEFLCESRKYFWSNIININTLQPD